MKKNTRLYSHIRSSQWKIPYFKAGSYICCVFEITRKYNILAITEHLTRMKYAALE